MEVFNDSLLGSSKTQPLIISDLKKTDIQVAKIKEHLTPSKIIAQGFFKNLYANNMTEAGAEKAYSAMASKIINNIVPTTRPEIDEIVKLYQTAGLIKRNETVPKDFVKMYVLGSKDNAIPEYVGVSLAMPFELDTKKLMTSEGFTEDDVKKHFDDIKAYWALLESGAADSGSFSSMLAKVNDCEDSFYSKACDYNNIIAGKTLTRNFGVRALCCTHKGCRNIKYCPDPWISFCLEMNTLRIKDNKPDFEVQFKLKEWESSKAFDSCSAKYFMEVVLYYKVNKKLFGMEFERNGTTY